MRPASSDTWRIAGWPRVRNGSADESGHADYECVKICYNTQVFDQGPRSLSLLRQELGHVATGEQSGLLPRWLRPPIPLNHSKRIAILGATGSIGQSTLAVLRHASQATDSALAENGRFRLFGISGHENLADLAAAAREFQPDFVVCSNPESNSHWSESCPEFSGRFETGADALVALASHPHVDVVVAAIVGRAGLESTMAAIESGKLVALANKETLVVAGHLATDLATKTDARILPVDSEHSAIFQCLHSGCGREIRRVILTASGGPFRTWTAEQQRNVTPEQARAHPTWKMGAKISIDSATMMNKALELIEAKWLFGLEPEQLEVVVHPESIVHSMVEFVDGSILAQCSPPDMKLPIQAALDYPNRFDSPASRLDFSSSFGLNFEPPDMDRFPALLVGLEVASRGGSCGVVLNAANEVAVQAFLERRIRFSEIVPVCRKVLDSHPFEPYPDLKSILELDCWARLESCQCISSY
ncbi:MAG: 1-deoxy-D-xylulose-5-phosphate reductoisomerase [Pirellulaceae bacterium]|nr:1-deoxy-D-xylulose-5-phosphate reductoisomerase [Pirellulaceae bacterium]